MSRAWFDYLLGLALGIACGVLAVELGDLLLTALAVLASTMLLGGISPQRPWRWTLLVAVFVPLVQLLAYVVLTEKPFRAQIFESILSVFPGIAGAYAGAFAHRGLHELFGK
ncbi:MAG TPA: hypothetical protein VLV49_17340 [Terriglobales bacterium]|nr:hypothetical protein [Terriglobales bacterium]